MGKQVAVVLYVVAMVAVIIGVDFVFQKPILGTADSEYWDCLGVRSFLSQILQVSMNKARYRPSAAIVQTHFALATDSKFLLWLEPRGS
jgi:hypothetical protein